MENIGTKVYFNSTGKNMFYNWNILFQNMLKGESSLVLGKQPAETPAGEIEE